jgi:hypothetical protein
MLLSAEQASFLFLKDSHKSSVTESKLAPADQQPFHPQGRNLQTKNFNMT